MLRDFYSTTLILQLYLPPPNPSPGYPLLHLGTHNTFQTHTTAKRERKEVVNSIRLHLQISERMAPSLSPDHVA